MQVSKKDLLFIDLGPGKCEENRRCVSLSVNQDEQNNLENT